MRQSTGMRRQEMRRHGRSLWIRTARRRNTLRTAGATIGGRTNESQAELSGASTAAQPRDHQRNSAEESPLPGGGITTAAAKQRNPHRGSAEGSPASTGAQRMHRMHCSEAAGGSEQSLGRGGV